MLSSLVWIKIKVLLTLIKLVIAMSYVLAQLNVMMQSQFE